MLFAGWVLKVFQPENVANKLQFPGRSWTHFQSLNELCGATLFPLEANAGKFLSLSGGI